MQYKTVAAPVKLKITGNDYSDAVKQYAAIINKETVGGWKLECIKEIPVTKKAGCLGSLIGQKEQSVYFNMLVFSKED